MQRLEAGQIDFDDFMPTRHSTNEFYLARTQPERSGDRLLDRGIRLPVDGPSLHPDAEPASV